MLVKLYGGNYSTHYVLVNGVDEIFQASSKLINSQEVIWILFNNFKVVNWKEQKMHTFMKTKYIPCGHQ